MIKFRFINIGQTYATHVSNLVVGLSKIQSDLYFEYSSDIIEPDKRKKLEDGSYSDDYFHDLIKNYMHKKKYNELPIGVTNYPLADELYSSCYEDSAVLSFANWDKFCKYSIPKGLRFLVSDAILSFFLDMEAHENFTIGCPSDFCDNLSDINIGMEKAEYCDDCKRLINTAVENNNITLSTVATIYRLLDEVAERRVCFILIPFNKEFDPIYSTIKEVASERGYYCSRDSEMSGHSVIMDTIKEMIMRSDLIIADLSNKNPNVFYELGYAHALGKNAILLTQDPEIIPFDLRQRRYIQYETTSDLAEKLKSNLTIRKKY